MAKRGIVIVLDSVGCGGAPDAAAYGDEGADTLGHLFSRIPGLHLPILDSLGLAQLTGRSSQSDIRKFSHAFRLTESSAGKDTTVGHWELMSCLTKQPFFTCEAFPDDFLDELAAAGGTGFIGNKAASGTVILEEHGEEHLRTGNPYSAPARTVCCRLRRMRKVLAWKGFWNFAGWREGFWMNAGSAWGES